MESVWNQLKQDCLGWLRRKLHDAQEWWEEASERDALEPLRITASIDETATQEEQVQPPRLTEKTMQLELPIALTNYMPPTSNVTFIMVGCGGTGGYLLPNLARLVANLEHRTGKIILLDGDIVEQKNLKRQNFIAPDLGRHKSQVLAERYSAALGLEIQYETEYMKDETVLERLTPDLSLGATVVLGCVDNHKTRQIIARWFRAKKGRIWIDAGNEELHGQVVCGYSGFPYRKDYKNEPFALPSTADLFPEIDTDEKAMFNDELSCAERAAENPQNIATNIMAANYMLVFAQQVLLGNPLHSHGIFFSAERATADPLLNLPSRLDTRKWDGYKGPSARPRFKNRFTLSTEQPQAQAA